MFSLNSENFLLSKDIEGQFVPFRNEEGKLPSFSVCFHPLSDADINGLTLLKSLGDYCFYKDAQQNHWISFCGCYAKLRGDYAHADVYMSDSVRSDGEYEASYLLMQAYVYRLVSTGSFMIHSAAAVYKNSGILFCGLSGAGKSTQANLWKRYLHCTILNYDKPCVINDGGAIYAHGSPWSGKERMIKNEFVPLKAIVYVVQAKQNSVRRLCPAEALSHIYLHNYVFPLTEKVEEQYLAAINAVAANVPVYELSCDISEEAVAVLYNTIFEKSYQEAKKEFVMRYKVKEYFQMRNIADEYVVIPRGTQAIDFTAAVVLNEAGAFLWEQLQAFTDEKTLAAALQAHYGIDAALAQKDAHAFLEKMDANGLIDKKED
ncbi:MAG: PqqD family peptide modification chaperone [Clostridia bacterium]|nr:PqqD family peptide modification chaperone [Clostridia bacterium]